MTSDFEKPLQERRQTTTDAESKTKVEHCANKSRVAVDAVTKDVEEDPDMYHAGYYQALSVISGVVDSVHGRNKVAVEINITSEDVRSCILN